MGLPSPANRRKKCLLSLPGTGDLDGIGAPPSGTERRLAFQAGIDHPPQVDRQGTPKNVPSGVGVEIPDGRQTKEAGEGGTKYTGPMALPLVGGCAGGRRGHTGRWKRRWESTE